jgi:hypothetical protein
MGITKQASLLISAKYKDFDKAYLQANKIGRAMKYLARNTATFASAAMGKDSVANDAKGMSKRDRDIQSNIHNMSTWRKSINAVGKASNSSMKFVSSLLGLGAYFGLTTMADGFMSFAHSLHETQVNAAKLGTTAGLLSSFTYQMQQIGVGSQESLNAMQAVYDLNRRMNLGDTSAYAIAGKNQANAIEPRTIASLSEGRPGTLEFEKFQAEIRGLADDTQRASRLLMVLGKEAYGVANAFTNESFAAQERAKQEAMLNGMGGANKNSNAFLDNTLDRLHTTLTVFNAAATQFKMAFLQIASVYLEVYASIINGVLREAKNNGVSLTQLAMDSIDKLWAGVKMGMNLFIRIAQGIEKIATLVMYGINQLPGDAKLDIGGPDLKTALSNIDDKYNKRIWDENDKRVNILPKEFKEFEEIQKAGRTLMGIMARQETLMNNANSMIESNKPESKKLIEDLKHMMLIKSSPLKLLPQDIQARQYSKLITGMESLLGSQSLNMPNAQRMFSVDTESQISKSMLERELKGRDPMQRMVDGINQLVEIENRHNKLLEKLTNMKPEQVEQLLWGKPNGNP